MTPRRAVTTWLAQAGRVGPFVAVEATELATLAARVLGREVSVQVAIASAFDAGLLVQETSPWAFRLPRAWLDAQRDPAAAVLALLQRAPR